MARREITGKKPAQTADAAKRQAGPPKKTDPKAIEPIAHSEPDSRIGVKVPPIRGPPLDDDAPSYTRKPVRAEANTLAMSIAEFCRLHGISEDMFYKMGREGWGPATMKVGSRTLISHEAAADWRRERHAAAPTAA
jgi:hypothetical protein